MRHPWIAIAQLLKDIGADGLNFDTLESIPAQFRQASDAVGHPLALEPQFDIRDESLAWANIGWNDWVTWEGKEYPFVPMVSKSKWLEPRHTVNVTDRFTRDKTDSLQHAFFNGQGYATLDNLWGFWYGQRRMMPKPSCASPGSSGPSARTCATQAGSRIHRPSRQEYSPAASPPLRARCGRSSIAMNMTSAESRFAPLITRGCTITICGTVLS